MSGNQDSARFKASLDDARPPADAPAAGLFPVIWRKGASPKEGSAYQGPLAGTKFPPARIPAASRRAIHNTAANEKSPAPSSATGAKASHDPSTKIAHAGNTRAHPSARKAPPAGRRLSSAPATSA